LLKYIYHKTAEVVKQKFFLFWDLIFKTGVDKIKITTGEGTQEGATARARKE
jgi:hypothetical protein